MALKVGLLVLLGLDEMLTVALGDAVELALGV